MSIGLGSDIAALGAEALQEQFAEEVPCGRCGKSAMLRSFGHGGGAGPCWGAAYKCISCWQRWYGPIARSIAVDGRFACAKCDAVFASVEAFADYRPF